MITLNIHSTLVGTFDFISETDSAVDKKAKNFDETWEKYREGVGDPPLLAGKEPTVWKIRNLRPGHMRKLSSYLVKAMGEEEFSMTASWAVTAVALEGAENLKDEHGHNLKIEFEKDDDGEKIVAMKSMEMLGFELIAEISGVALERRNLSPL